MAINFVKVWFVHFYFNINFNISSIIAVIRRKILVVKNK